MATTTITGLAAGSALAGTEVFAADQSGSTVKITATDISAFASSQIITSGSFTATLSGPFTSSISGTMNWSLIGEFATLRIGTTITGTATASPGQSISISGLPTALYPAANVYLPCARVQDNGDPVLGLVQIQTGGTVIVTLPQTPASQNAIADGSYALAAATFTASASAGLMSGWCVSYPLL